MIVELASLASTEIEDVHDESNGTSRLDAIWLCGVNSKTFVQVDAQVQYSLYATSGRPIQGESRFSPCTRCPSI
jgi:hypothetical protein